MSLRTVCTPLVTALVLPLLAAPAWANSITTYGIIVTAMGNDLQVQYIDKPAGDGTGGSGLTGLPGGATADTGGSLLVTSNGNGGISITPLSAGTTAPESTPAGKGATGTGGGSTGGGDTLPTKDGGSNEDIPPVPVIVPEPSPPGTTNFDGHTEPPIHTPTNGGGPGSTANTPEPASLTLLALAGVGGLYARRRRS